MTRPRRDIFGVLLTEDAWTDPQISPVLKTFARTAPSGAKYFMCSSIDTSDIYYLTMTPIDEKGTPFEMNVLVPHRYVRLIVAAPKESQIGFDRVETGA